MKTYLKRIAAPKTWPIARKEGTFISRPKPKGQKIAFTMPIVVVLRDLLKVVDTSKQAKTVMATETVAVNGKRIYNTDDAVGFMDILQIGKEYFRITIDEKSTLGVVPSKTDTTTQKIGGKTHLKGGKIQLNLENGMNILIAKDTYKVGDSVTVEKGKIKQHFALEKGAAVFITGGTHIGAIGSIKEIDNDTLIVTAGKESFQTTRGYAHVIGKDKPAI